MAAVIAAVVVVSVFVVITTLVGAGREGERLIIKIIKITIVKNK